MSFSKKKGYREGMCARIRPDVQERFLIPEKHTLPGLYEITVKH
jgi:hypothetical protein